MSAAVLLKKIQNKIIDRKTELCHHRPQSKAHSNEYENNTHQAEQSLPAWRGAGGSSRSTRPLLSSSDGARSCRNRPRCLVLYSSKKLKLKLKLKQPTPGISVVLKTKHISGRPRLRKGGVLSKIGEWSPYFGEWFPHKTIPGRVFF